MTTYRLRGCNWIFNVVVLKKISHADDKTETEPRNWLKQSQVLR